MASVHEKCVCGSCKKVVQDRQNAILCDGKCKMWWHISCASVSKKHYDLFKGVVEMQGIKWFCPTCDKSFNSKMDDNYRTSDVSDYTTFFSIITSELENISKNNLIMVERLTKMNSEHDNITNKLVGLEKNDSCKKISSDKMISSEESTSGSYRDVLNSNINNKEKHRQERGNSSNFDPVPVVEVDGVPTEVRENCEQIYGNKSFEEDFPIINDYSDMKDWVNVDRKKSRRLKNSVRNKNAIIGNRVGDEVGVGRLRVVEKLSWVFISRLAPEVDKQDLVDYLKDSDISISECVKLQTKYDTYSSFKVGLSPNLTPKVLNADLWPRGTLVSEYYQPRKNKSRVFLGKK